MFLSCFKFICSIIGEWLDFLFTITLDSSTSVTWGMLFIAIVFVIVCLKLLFEGIYNATGEDDYGLKYIPKHSYRPKHEKDVYSPRNYGRK